MAVILSDNENDLIKPSEINDQDEKYCIFSASTRNAGY